MPGNLPLRMAVCRVATQASAAACCPCRTLALVPFLQLQARLDGLPVEQLDMHMARQVADELGQPYQAVSWQAAALLARSFAHLS